MKEAADDEPEGKTSSGSDKKISRAELMEMSSRLIRLLHQRTTTKRFKPSGHDSPRLAYARATVAAVQAYTTLLRDSEIENLEKRIAELEGQMQGRNRS